ncbi:glucuronyl hydrolase [Chitinophaga parva]|uniref:Glucuronyl hydrolase n=1 Tax=Chitinophaga parva TaxID=2169414 RepID=A0A2T7BCX0_9BACT|nr:glycoside hydrolase family 88 protein [Chitinophaga parva]PUZ22941.1 glucuronyl hydrolase [Chitinophaga parva]
MKYFFAGLLLSTCMSVHAQRKVDVAKQLKLAAHQYHGMLQELGDTTTLFPQSINPDGSMKKMKSDWWCSGFFGGSLWYLYEYTKDTSLKSAAATWTEAVSKEQYNTGTHDLGFMLNCSFGNGYRITKNPAYRQVLLNGARSLSTRFNPAVGVIKSWNNFKGYKYPVIIDNMMNLELLCWATQTSGDKKFEDIARKHADKTIKNHFRPDYSSYHVVCYDSVGNVLAKMTAQGYADSSAWARGQAWGLYGYTMMYRETKDKRYLEQAKHIAAFYMHHPNLPADKIPYWDFNAPHSDNEPRDASAAAIVASALLELRGYVPAALGKTYTDFAEATLVSLSSPEYFAAEGNHHFLIKHCTGHLPGHSEIDTPLIYGDYYYIEALLRYNRIK